MVKGFVISGGEGESFLDIGQSSLGILLLVKLSGTRAQKVAGFGWHGKLMSRDSARRRSVLRFLQGLQADGENPVGTHGNIEIMGKALVAGSIDGEQK